MDAAILDALPEAAGLGGGGVRFPFTEDRKRETGVLRQDRRLFAAVKGAPEIVLALCNLDARGAADLAGAHRRVRGERAQGDRLRVA